jgi:hypothetical protein
VPEAEASPGALCRRVALVGAGLVGAGWAIVFARAGVEVALFDAQPGQAADGVGAGTAANQDGHQQRQEEAGDDHHDDLVGEHRDDALGSEQPEIGGNLLQRVLNHVAQWILRRHHPASLRSSGLQAQLFAALRRPSNHHVSTANSTT